MEWVLALHDGDGDEAGLAGALSRSVGLKRLGAVGRGSGLRGESLLTPCESVHNLRTISSNGAAVKTPPCMHRGLARAIRPIDGGLWAMISPVSTTSSPGCRRPTWTSSAGGSCLASKTLAAS